MDDKPWLVMPLYIYPLTTDTWGALYEVIAAHPDLNFLVVVNPNSGPGAAALPGHDYEREVPRLNAFANVSTVGYVRIDWCRRPLDDSYGDMRRYADWHHAGIDGLYVEGIYVDETPNHVSPARSEYLDAVTDFTKTVPGLEGKRWVIHNPGTPPEGPLADFGSPDLVCVCEEPFDRYRDANVQQRLHHFGLPWDQTVYQISGIPEALVPATVAELCGGAKYVFATDLVDDFYESFGPSWAAFAAAVRASGVRG